MISNTESNTLTLSISDDDLDQFRLDVIDGLSRDPGSRQLPSRYLYDRRGCELFEAICDTPEYYLTGTELRIMRRDAHRMAEVIGSGCHLVELGSGASIKTQQLLDQLQHPAGYSPVDISPDYLIPACERLRERYPDLLVEPVCANFAQTFTVPGTENADRTIVYFPGSTIGNFTRKSAVELLRGMKRLMGTHGGMLIGIDLKKDVSLLEAAYNDAAGVTAQFTLNLLQRIRRELPAEVDPEMFKHLARYNKKEGRIEIYLRSTRAQSILIDEHQFKLEKDELINTEYSYKYDLSDVQQLARQSGMALTHAWLDERNWFGVFFLSAGC